MVNNTNVGNAVVSELQKVDIAMRNAIEKQENGRFWRGDELNK